jgi:hypothetical protein
MTQRSIVVRRDGSGSASTGIIVIRVVAEVGDKRVPMLWVVMMDKPEDALAAVRFYLAPGCDVELTDYRISAETIRALALVPNQVKQL